MGTISRGMRNAFRNSLRTLSIVFILAVSIGLSIVMLIALKTVQAKIESVKSTIGNYITVSPAGIRGFEGGGELLTEQNATDISAISHVVKVSKTLSDRLRQEGSTTNFPGNEGSSNAITSLIPSIEPGSFGNRQRQFQSERSNNTSTPLAMPITITGTNNLDLLSAINASKLDLTGGEKFDPSSSENIAMLGKELAAKNNLSSGQTFKAYNQDIIIVGIFDAGNNFANASVLMPLKTVQTLSGQTDQINNLFIQTDSIDSLSSAKEAIRNKLGQDKIDVTFSEETAQNAISPLENIKTISLYSLFGSLIAGAVIIFLTMTMIVRERRKEIGVLKAIGGSNAIIVTQFAVESLVLTLLSGVFGIILGLALSNPVLSVLINNSASTSSVTREGGGPGQGMMRMGAEFGARAQSSLRDLHAVVGTDIILYGFLAAIIIAILGSVIPAFIISKVRPAEVLRSE